MSKDSIVYHRPGCLYAKRIKPVNLVKMGVEDMKYHGFTPCSCCNSLHFVYKSETNIEKPVKRWGLTLKMAGEELFVKTNISLWKLIYSKKSEKITLFHRNHSEKGVNFEEPWTEKFHKQWDFAESNNISSVLEYIFEHDRYREARKNGKKLPSGVSKRCKRLAKCVERKERRKKVDKLFEKLEKSDPSLKKLSIN